jgi:hypothetical protein
MQSPAQQGLLLGLTALLYMLPVAATCATCCAAATGLSDGDTAMWQLVLAMMQLLPLKVPLEKWQYQAPKTLHEVNTRFMRTWLQLQAVSASWPAVAVHLP